MFFSFSLAPHPTLSSQRQLPVRVLHPFILGNDVPAPNELPLFRQQPFDADGPARVDPRGADADLGAEAEAEAVGEARRGVGEDAGRVDGVDELRDGGVAGREDGVGVAAAVRVDVGDRGC